MLKSNFILNSTEKKLAISNIFIIVCLVGAINDTSSP